MMSKKYDFCRHAIVIFLLSLSMIIGCPLQSSHAVSAAPNKAEIIGMVKEFSYTFSSLYGMQPDQELVRLVISIETVNSIGGYPNFLKSKAETNVTVFSKKQLPADYFKQKIRAIISYRGDERGGKWWIEKIDLIDRSVGQ